MGHLGPNLEHLGANLRGILSQSGVHIVFCDVFAGSGGPKVAFVLVFTLFLLVFVVPTSAVDPAFSPPSPRLLPGFTLWGLGKSGVFHKNLYGAQAKVMFSKSWPRAAPQQTKSVCNPVD